MDSLSITPPLSPAGVLVVDVEETTHSIEELDEDDSSTVACFDCGGEVGRQGEPLLRHSYSWSHHFHRLINKQQSTGASSADNNCIQLFSYHWPKHVWTCLELDKVFLCLRQNIGDIQAEVNVYSRGIFSNTENRCNVFSKRLCVNACLHQLQNHILRSSNVADNKLEKIVTCLHHVLLYMGRLPGHLAQASVTGNKTSSGSYHSFHVQLDIYWRIVSILHTVDLKYPGYRWRGQFTAAPVMECAMSSTDQVVQVILWDLVVLAHQRYLNQVVSGNYEETSMFSCTCVREMWLLLIHLLQWRAHHMDSESFWISLHHIIKTLTTPSTDSCSDMETDSDMIVNPPDGLTVSDATSLCLWIMLHVAPLFNTRLAGAIQEVGSPVVSNYHDVTALVKQYLTGPSVTESSLRRHLRTLYKLSLLWEPSTTILVNLWDYFFRKLNSTFQLTNASVEGLATVQLSVVAMFDRCKNWTQAQELGLGSETSFELFQRLLAQHLGQLWSSGATHEWKQIKGRFYSKFHQRRMQELTEGGLYNFTSLFLTLALTTDVTDVASKLCDFYDMLDYSRMTFAKRAMIWRGAFALMLVHEDRRLDVGFLVDKMVRALDSSIKDFTTADVDTKFSLWKLILVYLDGTQDVFDASPCLTLSEHRLICSGLKLLLPSCSDSELRKALCISQNIIMRFRQLTEDYVTQTADNKIPHQHTELADNLWCNLFPFVKEHATTLTPPAQLADIAAAFCLMAQKFPPCMSVGPKMTFVTLFQMFGMGDNVNASISCRFLGHLLPNGAAMEELGQRMPDLGRDVVKGWIRCTLLLPTQQVTEVTRYVLRLAAVRRIFTVAGVDVPDNLDTAPLYFFKAIKRAHGNLQSWKDKMELRGQVMDYFTDVPRYVAPVLRSLGPPDTLSNVYRVAGSLVKYCAPLIFVQSKPDCPLPTIISTMLTPHYILDRERTVSAVLLTAIRESLHLFLQGLSKLDYTKAPYVQRRLKDLITIYLPKFSPRGQQVLTLSTVSSVHPIVSSLGPSFSQHATVEAVKFRHFVMQNVLDNFVAVRNLAPHSGHYMGWNFLLDVIQRTTNTETLTRDVPLLLRPCLEYLLLLTDSSPGYQPVLSTLQHMTEAHSENTKLPLSVLKEICEKFLSDYFKFYNEGVIRVMEKLAVLAVDLVISVIEKLSRCVKEVENKRGVGVDANLRQRYCRLLRQLGPRAAQELNNMEMASS